jgi:hypothetical protein
VPRIDEIAYRQRKRTPTERELSTPTLDERFLAQQHATGKPALVAFLVLLNTFQHLKSQKGYSLLKNSKCYVYKRSDHPLNVAEI